MEEADQLQGMLELMLGNRSYVLIYETLDGKSGLVTNSQSRKHIIDVLLVSAEKLHKGGFR